MNTTYRNLILSRIHATVGAANALANISHQCLKGQLREIVIRDLLRPFLPSDIGLATGKIITVDGRQSRQQDIILFDKSILPPILLEEYTGLFPIESALYTIEIKSMMTANETRKSDISATEIQSFDYLSGEYDDHDKAKPHTFFKVISTVFAFDTDLSYEKKNDLERYNEIRTSTNPAISAICIAGKGYWYWKRGEWKS